MSGVGWSGRVGSCRPGVGVGVGVGVVSGGGVGVGGGGGFTQFGGGDMEIQKSCLIYNAVTSSVCLRHNQTFHCGLNAVIGEKIHQQTPCGTWLWLCAMVKTTQDGDLNVHV